MIKLDYKFAVNDSLLEKYKEPVRKIATKIEDLNIDGFEYLGWKDIAELHDKVEFEDIKKTVQRLKHDGVEALVVIGADGTFAGAKAAIEMVQGKYHTGRDMEVIFAGDSLSSTNLAQKLSYCEGKNFAINIISHSSNALEASIAFRLFRKLLEEKVGIHNSSKFIIATTYPNKSEFLKYAKDNDYSIFELPENTNGRFQTLSPSGLLPMACAGLDIDEVMEGALRATQKYRSVDINSNPAYKYAAIRHAFSKRYSVELLAQFEEQMEAFGNWWRQLFAEAEGKNDKGIFPATAVFTNEIHSLGQFIQNGKKVLFQTSMIVENPTFEISISAVEGNKDVNIYLTSLTLNEINQKSYASATDAHVKIGKVPNIEIKFGRMDEFNFGELVIFFERAAAMSAYLFGVNPFKHPGAEVYKFHFNKSLEKKD